MKYKDLYTNIKTKILEFWLPFDSEYGFDLTLKTSSLNPESIFCLHYVYFCTVDNGFNAEYLNDYYECSFSKFKFPVNMQINDAFKVLSYLADDIEKTCTYTVGSYENMKLLDEIINNCNLGFRSLTYEETKEFVKPIDLYAISGKTSVFQNANNTLNWYTKGVNMEDVVSIYTQIGIDFDNLKKEVLSRKLSKTK